MIAAAQKKGKTCAFVDAEHAWDLIHAAKLGVNVDDLLISQPDTGEQALEKSATCWFAPTPLCHHRRLRGGPDPESGNRRRDGGFPRRPAGPSDVPGAAAA
ncbi:hypothetical protein ACLK2C_14370 [Escherichia coli]